MPRLHVLGDDGAWVNGELLRTERGPETRGFWWCLTTVTIGFLVDIYILLHIILIEREHKNQLTWRSIPVA